MPDVLFDRDTRHVQLPILNERYLKGLAGGFLNSMSLLRYYSDAFLGVGILC
jgi:hypothetical protein